MLMSKQWNFGLDYIKDNLLYMNCVCNVIYEISARHYELLRVLFPTDNNNTLTSLIINLLEDIYLASMRLQLSVQF